MFKWLRKSEKNHEADWVSVAQPPKEPFPFPVGLCLEAEEEVILLLPKKVINDGEKIGDIIIADSDTELALREDLDAWLVKLKPGFRLSVGRSCQAMVVADDDRPRRLKLRKPQ